MSMSDLNCCGTWLVGDVTLSPVVVEDRMMDDVMCLLREVALYGFHCALDRMIKKQNSLL